MTNPKTQASVVKEAYAAGQEKLGTKPTGLTHEITELPVAGSGASVAAGWHPELKPGQTYHSRGTTIANPQPSDIEVETMIGRKVYDPKPDPRSKEEIVLNATKQESEIGELKTLILQQQQQINAFIAGATAQTIGQDKTPEIPKSIENNVEPVSESVSDTAPEPDQRLKSELSMSEIRAIAKGYSIKAPVGIKKNELIALIERAERVREAG